MGAALIMDDYVNFLRIAKKANAVRAPAWANNSSPDLDRAFDPFAAGVFKYSELGRDNVSDAEIVMGFYAWMAEQGYAYPEITYGKQGYRYLDAPELFAPSIQYLVENGWEPLAALFRVTYTNYGYGAMDITPAMYLQRYYSTGTFMRLSAGSKGGLPTMNITLNSVFQHMSKSVEDLRLNVNINKVVRGKQGVRVEYEQGGRNTTITCGRIILAFPQLLNRLEGWLDVTPEEKDVFGKVIKSWYFSTVVDLTEPLAAAGLTQLPFAVANSLINNGTIDPIPTGSGEPLLVYGQHYGTNATNVYVVYSYSRTPITAAEIRVKVQEHLSLVLSLNVTEDALVSPTYDWDYSPIFDTAALQQGYHMKAEALQGQRRTYYASGLYSCEDIECVISYSLDLVQRFFVRKDRVW